MSEDTAVSATVTAGVSIADTDASTIANTFGEAEACSSVDSSDKQSSGVGDIDHDMAPSSSSSQQLSEHLGGNDSMMTTEAEAAAAAAGAARTSTKSSTTDTVIRSIPLPPLPPDTTYIYPPSSFPPKELFETTIVHPAIIIPARRTAELRRLLKHVLMNRPKMKDVHKLQSQEAMEGAGEERKLVFKLKLDEPIMNSANNNNNYNDNNVKGQDERNINNNKANNEKHQASPIPTDNVYDDPVVRALLASAANNSTRKATHTVRIAYDDLAVEQVLQKLLPPSTARELPTSFEIIGHIARLNLCAELLPYQYLIGQVIREKNRPRIQIVVLKMGTIDNVYRTFPMKIICGMEEEEAAAAAATATTNRKSNKKDWSVVHVKEEGCSFELDFVKVYWNSRLGGEHRRLVRLILDDIRKKSNHHCDDDDSGHDDTTAGKEMKKESEGGQLREVSLIDADRNNHEKDKGMTCCTKGGNVDKYNENKTRDDDTDGSDDEDEEGIVVADVMAGVGPFAVPLTSPLSTSVKNFQTKHRRRLQQQERRGGGQEQQQRQQQQQQTQQRQRHEKITVHANDLNPTSYHYLRMNGRRNKCRNLIPYNMDGRQFIHLLNKNHVRVHHFIMNLPASAPEFLNAFRGFRTDKTNDDEQNTTSITTTTTTTTTMMNENAHEDGYQMKNNRQQDDHTSTANGADIGNMEQNTQSQRQRRRQRRPPPPRVHVYCFAPKNDANASSTSKSIARCEKSLGCKLDLIKHDVSLHVVRDVAPKKNMVCVSFFLPEEVSRLERIKIDAVEDAGESGGRETVEEEDEIELPSAKRSKN